MNPDSTDGVKLAIVGELGVTRCSFGVQTFDEAGLRLLGRRHDAKTALRVVKEAADMGFASVNVDLIHGWPGQTAEIQEKDIYILSNLDIHHISNYSLIVEEDAIAGELFRRLSADGAEDGEGERASWDRIECLLEDFGFEHYETSNFGRPGHRCLHNVLTWMGEEYLGIGVAAHSHIGGRRFANVDTVGEYLTRCGGGRSCEAFSEELDPEAKARECAAFWLRLFEGIDVEAFKRRTGYDVFSLYADVLPAFLSRGIMEVAGGGGRLRVAKEYQPVLDAVLADLI